MKRRDGTPGLFSLSALDALACATSVFVLLLVVLMPYYRNSFDQKAVLEELRASVQTSSAQVNGLEERMADESAKAEAALLEAQRLSAQVVRVQKTSPVHLPERPSAPPGGVPVTRELDLVFVIDTTASMTQVLDQLARSMASLVRILERLVPSVRIGVVAYRDHDAEPPLLRTLELTGTGDGLHEILQFVDSLQASRISSGTLQEAVYLGIVTAAALPFRPSARQALVLIGDAAPHRRDEEACIEHVRRFVADSPKRSVSALFTPTLSSLAFGNLDRAQFVALAKVGNGNFTDHAASMTESVLLSVLTD